MGTDEEAADDLDELDGRIKDKKMSEEATDKVQKEFKKLKLMAPMSAEATVVRQLYRMADQSSLVRNERNPRRPEAG